MRYYYVGIDRDENIIALLDTFQEYDEYIPITAEQYTIGLGFKKYNPSTGEFYEPIEDVVSDEPAEFVMLRETHAATLQVEEDNLINMDMLLALDDKLNMILEHLGLC